MEEHLGHKISEKTIELAQDHAQESAQHGKFVENVGKTMSADGASIAEQGRAIQEQLESGQVHLQELQQTGSTKAYGKVVEDHVQAGQIHVEAVKEYLNVCQHSGKAMSLPESLQGISRKLYEQLMALSQQALSGKLYETAYHTLAAAFHAAEALEDEQWLLAVERAAKAQQNRIDADTPKHWMSTQSTTQRGGNPMYGSLARQAATRVSFVKQKHH